MAISTVQGLAEGIRKDQKSLTKLGKQVGKIVGAKFKAQLADDVAEAIRSVEAQATAARAEAIATAQAQQAVITDQAVAQAISQIITRGDQRLGQLTRPLVA
jgi:vacuolar-type H+-ATPase subunit E/Vma4